ncbi:MAG: isoprenyl transferase [Alphaproteobacteria bacterium]|nr:isoprenyl transferase [Alphaproteobacteria bacterium]
MTAAQTQRVEARVPRHVAIIMDGNGRWARARGLPRIAGHRQGAEAVRRTVVSGLELGIEYLTIFAFSSENWKRPEREIDDLMGLLRLYLRAEIGELSRQGVRVRFIGDRNRLSRDIRSLIDEAERTTDANQAITLTIALNYGSRQEIVRAVRRLARDVATGALVPEDVDEAMFGRYLDTSEMPDPDLLIRTSGEQRLSNFLLWQSAYTELVYLPTLWPDFEKADLENAVVAFQRRERRYGASSG